jgi:hypothetical protein
MGKLRPPPLVPGRYPFDEVTAEIRRVLGWYPEGIYKRLNNLLGYSPGSRALSQGLRGVDAQTDFIQIGVIADEINAPTGWPFIRWEEAKSRDDMHDEHLKRLSRKGDKEH